MLLLSYIKIDVQMMTKKVINFISMICEGWFFLKTRPVFVDNLIWTSWGGDDASSSLGITGAMVDFNLVRWVVVVLVKK